MLTKPCNKLVNICAYSFLVVIQHAVRTKMGHRHFLSFFFAVSFFLCICLFFIKLEVSLPRKDLDALVGSARKEACQLRGKSFLKNNFPAGGVSKTLLLDDITSLPQYLEQVEGTGGFPQDSGFRVSTCVLYRMKNNWPAVSPGREREVATPVMLV